MGSIGAVPAVWSLAARAADKFWNAVASMKLAAPISPSMRELAIQNRQVAREFAATFLVA